MTNQEKDILAVEIGFDNELFPDNEELRRTSKKTIIKELILNAEYGNI